MSQIGHVRWVLTRSRNFLHTHTHNYKLNFLYTVNSRVISTALEGETYLEGQTSRLKMMYSEPVVKALLKYLYYRNLDAAAESCLVALDLLRASDYYHLDNLWNDVTTLFLRSELGWFTQQIYLLETFNFVAKVAARHHNTDELARKLMMFFSM